eukprot:3076900-Rhodomonas_salina.3
MSGTDAAHGAIAAYAMSGTDVWRMRMVPPADDATTRPDFKTIENKLLVIIHVSSATCLRARSATYLRDVWY